MIKLNRLCFAAFGRTPSVIGTQFWARYSASTKSKPSEKQILLKIRKDTGYPLMKCKQALMKTNYDVEKAIESLNEDAAKEGWEKMKTLSGRRAKQGLVTIYRADDHAVLLEVNCESDFVAKTTDFQSFVSLVAKTVLEHHAPAKTEQITLAPDDILKLPIPTMNKNIEEALAKVIGKVKENVHVSRGILTSVNGDENEIIGIYTHPDLGTPIKGGRFPLMGRFAAIVGIKSKATEPQGQGWLLGKARDLAQHIVGMNPTVIGSRDSEGSIENPPSSDQNPLSSAHSTSDPDSDIDDADEMENLPNYSFGSDELLKQSFLLDENITVQNWLDIHQFDVKYFVRYQLGGDD